MEILPCNQQKQLLIGTPVVRVNNKTISILYQKSKTLSIKKLLSSTFFDSIFSQNLLYLIKGDGHMKELYKKSLRMIKYGNIKSVKQYNRMTECYQIMNLFTLKYISGTNNFREIIKLAQEI